MSDFDLSRVGKKVDLGGGFTIERTAPDWFRLNDGTFWRVWQLQELFAVLDRHMVGSESAGGTNFRWVDEPRYP